MRTDRAPFYNIFGIILFSFFLVSCEDVPDYIGGDILPSGDGFTVLFDSMEIAAAYNKVADSIPAGYSTYYLLGNVHDPFYGKSRAEIVSTIMPSITSKGFGNGARSDSVKLYLALEERLGEGSMPLSIRLYEFAENIEFDSLYFSDFDMSGKYLEPELGSAFIEAGDSMVHILIDNQDFIDKFLTAEDSILKSSNYLRDSILHGIYFTTDEAGDEGGIYKIDFDDVTTYLYFYYHNDSTDEQLSQYYSLGNSRNARLSLFNHDRTGYPVEEYMGDNGENDTIIFIQSMAGLSPIISFPELEHWKDSGAIAINEARLILRVADTLGTFQNTDYFPRALNMYLVQNDGRYTRTYDQILNSESFGGEFDKASMSYSFSVKTQVQSIIQGDVENLKMVLLPYYTTETLSRIALNGWSNDPGKRIRLEITYTRL